MAATSPPSLPTFTGMRKGGYFRVPGSFSLYSSSVFVLLGVFVGGFALSTERLAVGFGKLRQGAREGINQVMRIRRPGSSPSGTPTTRRSDRPSPAIHRAYPVLRPSRPPKARR